MITNHEDADTYRLSPSLKIASLSSRQTFLSWNDPQTGRERMEQAGPDELLGIKMVAEKLCVKRLAGEHNLPVSRFYRLLSVLDRKGILQAPKTLLRRNPALFGDDLSDDRLTITVFTLQWHITNACDLHCRHCYDRTKRSPMTEAQALHALDAFERFCHDHWVSGYICFAGGNPFLYPEFPDLYKETVRRGFDVGILGNPVQREQIEAICHIKPPDFYQMSLEGRRAHNDAIRGHGTYDRVIAFAGILRELGVPCHIMLTATDANLKEILPLAALLSGRVDGFSFSRLCPTGEGAALRQPDPLRYRAFLKRYIRKGEKNRCLNLKENLLSLALAENDYEISDGCTGFGCGAAFNCLPLLPDGEVHACRRFPSLLGNIQTQSFDEIYCSEAAERFRRGLQACNVCPLKHACGGCMAASARDAGNTLPTRDPYCWKCRPVMST